jgi:group I intron endonuclease
MYIYKITNQLNGKAYVGLKTLTVEESTDYYGSGKLIQLAIEKYGKENFTKEILERGVDSFDELCSLERHYIVLHDTKINGYNMTDGGLGMYGYTPTEEHRKNMSDSISGEKHPQYGTKLSDQRRKELSEIAKKRKGRPVSEETRKKIAESMKGKRNAAKNRLNF